MAGLKTDDPNATPLSVAAPRVTVPLSGMAIVVVVLVVPLVVDNVADVEVAVADVELSVFVVDDTCELKMATAQAY